MDFDTLEEATAGLRATGSYGSGVLMEWREHSAIWDLLEQYPSRITDLPARCREQHRAHR
jgi:hypothetical protein